MVHWGTESCDPPTPVDDTDGYWRRLLVESAGMVGLARVTEANIEEWLWRFAYLRTVVGRDAGCLIFTRKGERVFDKITPQILRRWVGLWTNWSDISRHAFVKVRQERLEDECAREVHDAMAAEPATSRHSGSKGTKKRRVKA
jgi:hypothetical protein